MDLIHVISDQRMASCMFLESPFNNGYSDGKGLGSAAKQHTFDIHY